MNPLPDAVLPQRACTMYRQTSTSNSSSSSSDTTSHRDNAYGGVPNRLLPAKPKKGLTAYNLYFQAQRQEMLQSSSNVIGFAAMARTVAKRWKSVCDEERSFYENLAQIDKERYDREMEIYERYIPAEMKRKCTSVSSCSIGGKMTASKTKKDNKKSQPSNSKRRRASATRTTIPPSPPPPAIMPSSTSNASTALSMFDDNSDHIRTIMEQRSVITTTPPPPPLLVLPPTVPSPLSEVSCISSLTAEQQPEPTPPLLSTDVQILLHVLQQVEPQKEDPTYQTNPNTETACKQNPYKALQERLGPECTKLFCSIFSDTDRFSNDETVKNKELEVREKQSHGKAQQR